MQLKTVPINRFTFGIEIENYCEDWNRDHDDTKEIRSRVFKKFNGLLIFARNVAKRHIDDENFWLHSFPNKNYNSSISGHIHLKANIKEWKEYKWVLYDRLFDLIYLFQFFFKNSPHKENKTLSYRHSSGTWCDLEKMNKQRFDNSGREYMALTKNGGFDTLEFRYNDIPKSLNQLAMFYYLVYLASRKNLNIPRIEEFLIHKVEDVESPITPLFSYKDINSIRNYKKSYKTILNGFVKEVDKNVKKRFYNFYTNKYSSFGKLVMDSLDYELDKFKKFFENGDDEFEWSEAWKKKFCKKIVKDLIK